MNPRIDNVSSKDNTLTFRLHGVNVSLANAIRRTIISDIRQVIFKTTPYEQNRANIEINTSRLNNEILKQRLSCIPIHIKDMEMPLQNYIMELDVQNQTDTIMYVTTEHFKIKNITRNEYLSEKDTREIFPANSFTGYFIDFLVLRPKISDEIPGERIKMTCEFTIGTAKEDAMFNAVSTCSYGYTVDEGKLDEDIAKKQQEWKDAGKNKDEIEFETKNWRLLEGQRVTVKDSFDFIIESVGVFTNEELVLQSCDILIRRLNELSDLIDQDELSIEPSVNTMRNCYDITLENEDYTIGKLLEFMMYSKYYEDAKTLTFCGFKKMHPHDSNSIIRVAYADETDKAHIKQNLKVCIADSVEVYIAIKKRF